MAIRGRESMSVEEIRKVFEEELGPELREMRRILSNIKRRLEIKQIRADSAIQRNERMRRSSVFEARISALEAAKRISH
jgi:hypothetical protein